MSNSENYYKQFPVIDYHDFTHKGTSKEKRAELHVGDIYLNALECKECGYFIRSRNRHDFVSCKCGAIAIDGGSEYVKVLNYKKANIITEFYDDVVKEKQLALLETIAEDFADNICCEQRQYKRDTEEYNNAKTIVKEKLVSFFNEMEDVQCES